MYIAVAAATGFILEPTALTALPLVLFPALAVPFFTILHLVAVIQSRQGWSERVARYRIGDLGVVAGRL